MIYFQDTKQPLSLAFDDVIEQEGNGKYTLNFKYPTTVPEHNEWQLLTKEMGLIADDLHGEQFFEVVGIKKHLDTISVYAEHVSHRLHKIVVNEISVDRVKGQGVMNALVAGVALPHPFTFFSDIEDRHTLNLKKVSVFDVIANGKHSILGQWGGELVRDKYHIKLFKRFGRDTETLFMYKKNLNVFEENVETNQLITRLRLSIKDTNIQTTVDSPLISQYKYIYEKSIEVSDQDVKTEEALNHYGRRYFQTTLCDVVTHALKIEVTENYDDNIRLFDTCIVHHEKYGIDMRMQINFYSYSPISKKILKIGFGQTTVNLSKQLQSSISTAVENSVNRAVETHVTKELKNVSTLIDNKLVESTQGIENEINIIKSKAEETARKIESEVDKQIATLQESGTLIPDGSITGAKIRAGSILTGHLTAGAVTSTILSTDAVEAKHMKIDQALVDKLTTDDLLARKVVTSQLFTGAVQTVDLDASKIKVGDLDLQRARIMNGSQEVFAIRDGRIIANLQDTDVATKRDVRTAINSLQIGGRNLFKGTRDWSGEQWQKPGNFRVNGTFNDCQVLSYVSGSKANDFQRVAIKANTAYTFSGYVKRDTAGRVLCYLDNGTYDNPNYRGFQNGVVRANTFDTGTEWFRYVKTFVPVEDMMICPRFATYDSAFSVACFKLEQGTVATDWTPAPEDLKETVVLSNTAPDDTTKSWIDSTTLQMKIFQNNEWVVVNSHETIKQQLTDRMVALEGVIVKKEDLDILNNVMLTHGNSLDTYKRLANGELNQLRQFYDRVENKVDKLSQHFAYTSNGLEVSSPNSNIKTVYDNYGMSWWDNGIKVAYINNQRLFINSGVFVHEMIVAKHKLTTIPNIQGTVIVYLGENMTGGV